MQEPNQAPTIRLSAPLPGRTMEEGQTLSVEAEASDPDGNVTRVEFFVDATPIGQDAAAPYQITWAPSEPGQKSLTAIAYDDDEASTTSEPVSITVVEKFRRTEN